MHKRLLIIVGVGIVIMGIWVFSFFLPFSLSYEKAIVTVNDTTFICDIADTDEKRQLGLSFRSNLNEDECMLFLFEQKGIYRFWMRDMFFPLDILWIYDERIVDISTHLMPVKSDEQLILYAPKQEVNMVMEIQAGRSETLKIQEGDRITIDFLINTR